MGDIVDRMVAGMGYRPDRGFVVRQLCRKAIEPMRELEDWARLNLCDERLAARARECHEEITLRILNGRYSVGMSRAQLEQALAYCDSDYSYQGEADRLNAEREGV